MSLLGDEFVGVYLVDREGEVRGFVRNRIASLLQNGKNGRQSRRRCVRETV